VAERITLPFVIPSAAKGSAVCPGSRTKVLVLLGLTQTLRPIRKFLNKSGFSRLTGFGFANRYGSNSARRVNFARDRLDLTAATEIPRACAISRIEYPLACQSSTTCRQRGGSRSIASLSNASFSLRTQLLSGSSPRNFNSQGACLPLGSLVSSSESSKQFRFFRKIISAELIAIRVSQVEKFALSSNIFRCVKALIKES
jgi:hypothetical protein